MKVLALLLILALPSTFDSTALKLQRGEGNTVSEQRPPDPNNQQLGPHKAIEANQVKDCLLELTEPHGTVVIKFGDDKLLTIFPDNTIALVQAGKMIYGESD